MLTFIFQQSFNSGTFQYDWSQAMVVPVHKKSNKKNPANYRPISLTCLACKLMEHIVLSHLNQQLSTNSILSPAQHGFCAGMSCETQLVLTCHDWANILNQQGQVDALLLDFSKAFDKVSHATLLHKLGQYGVNGKTLQWISGFLHNRTQYLAINGSHSSIFPVTSGVPLGKSGFIQAKWLFSGKSGCIRAKVFAFGQSGRIREEVVVFGQKWLYSGKSGCICAKMVVFGQSGCIRAKVVVFLQSGCIRAKWLYWGKSGCI